MSSIHSFIKAMSASSASILSKHLPPIPVPHAVHMKG